MTERAGENAPPHAGPGSDNALPDGGMDGSPVNPPGDETAEVRMHGSRWNWLMCVAGESQFDAVGGAATSQ